ncbi:hypothetical protein MPTK1_5g00340 [Marchantia polymorpha subsp. ruderalis]|uniref:PLAC8 family protein n=2 Tax=Marchantia polymorpha TaxID=3197 RepID=A0AAF6BDE9_MARPO|nr:hypothetical protein MARPO_0078s0034 [Marchantia polymorpha]BBN10033.1 hypothetical protein Mp_5g00340 [Marchantia polymorpha subsp. ruderalis]|eukprot:PTQ34627.1 hypothetical protein MARPO_0078s0034 [Marchantia polymorpha]
MASSKNKALLEARKDLPNVWHSPLMYTLCDSPLYCCYSVLCPYCAAYQLRGRALHGDWSRFTCCQGSMPCSGSCGESKCPKFCAVTEVCCCFTLSVATTRFMLQDELRIQNTKCDNCIIGTMFVLQYLNCICSIVACLTDIPLIDEAALITDRVADIAYCSVCACMQTQHKMEMDKRDGLIEPRDGTVVRAPPTQHMMK